MYVSRPANSNTVLQIIPTLKGTRATHFFFMDSLDDEVVIFTAGDDVEDPLLADFPTSL